MIYVTRWCWWFCFLFWSNQINKRLKADISIIFFRADISVNCHSFEKLFSFVNEWNFRRSAFPKMKSKNIAKMHMVYGENDVSEGRIQIQVWFARFHTGKFEIRDPRRSNWMVIQNADKTLQSARPASQQDIWGIGHYSRDCLESFEKDWLLKKLHEWKEYIFLIERITSSKKTVKMR